MNVGLRLRGGKVVQLEHGTQKKPLAPSTCLGHKNAEGTYWYLEATALLVRRVSDDLEQHGHIYAGVERRRSGRLVAQERSDGFQ
ncbi:MAG: hypothetical protein OXN89_10090 [Bryobacterales bacterium]|nr:hypothetical protein [Bryobacterales bacterium]